MKDYMNFSSTRPFIERDKKADADLFEKAFAMVKEDNYKEACLNASATIKKPKRKS